jgi:hypothetical protein
MVVGMTETKRVLYWTHSYYYVICGLIGTMLNFWPVMHVLVLEYSVIWTLRVGRNQAFKVGVTQFFLYWWFQGD